MALPDRIFVAIAAYREPELRLTIEDCIATASDPTRLTFGVCLQHDRSGPPETQPDCLDGLDADLRLDSVDWTMSRGGCWARHRAQGLYRGEAYTMQIDSHMRMADGWDRTLITAMHELPSAKPLITGHCPLYSLSDDNEVDKFGGYEVPTTICGDFAEHGWIHHPSRVDPASEPPPRPVRFLSGGFVFTLGAWNIEVRQDPEHLYTGEEFALSIRSFTWGYDLYNPPTVVAWHRYHPEGNKKYIYDGADAEVSRRDLRAYQRLRLLLAGDPDRVLEPYSVGPLRSVAEYARWSGLHFATRTVSDDAKNGRPPVVAAEMW